MIHLTITFHGPFQVSTGSAGPGRDTTVDRHNLLPSTSLKGLMRYAAKHVLTLPCAVVEEVFGSNTTPSPWAWTDAQFARKPIVTPSARIKITGDRGRVEEGFLMLGEQVWAEKASFDVIPVDVPDDRLDQQRLVLEGSARAVTSLGSHRHRGSGWVSISGGPWTEQATGKLLDLRRLATETSC